jgi:hypothetical protein
MEDKGVTWLLALRGGVGGGSKWIMDIRTFRLGRSQFRKMETIRMNISLIGTSLVTRLAPNAHILD